MSAFITLINSFWSAFLSFVAQFAGRIMQCAAEKSAGHPAAVSDPSEASKVPRESPRASTKNLASPEGKSMLCNLKGCAEDSEEDSVRTPTTCSTPSTQPVSPASSTCGPQSDGSVCFDSESSDKESEKNVVTATKISALQGAGGPKAGSALKTSGAAWKAKNPLRHRAATEPQTDEEIVCSMKSILNKLTIEKFYVLSGKLLACGIKTKFHLETLVDEVFAKATTQHHFINMYADLCTAGGEAQDDDAR